MMKTVKTRPVLFAAPALLALCLSAVSVAANDTGDSAWHQFLHALGEPAPIAVNATHAAATEVTRPLPDVDTNAIDIHRFLLGSDLFHERRLSSDATQGCVTCHAGPVSGTDGRPVSFGVNRARGKVNALTTLNAHLNFRQFWDGRSVTLEDQVLEPIISELEMASTLDDALQSLVNDPAYAAGFEAIYADGVTINNMADAMAHFMSVQFHVSNSPFQQYLAQPGDQISDAAKRGWQQFQAIGCTACHNGVNLGGNSYQRLGAVRDFYPSQRDATENDAGVASRTLSDKDLYVVKVPNLHNIAMTLPYLHDGSVRTLEETVALMARYQLDRDLNEQDISDIAEFLKSLTGSPFGVAHSNVISRLARDAGEPSIVQAPASTHARAYLQSLEGIAPAFQQLLDEMQKIDQGTVKHFDFLQFQHLELIRHTRALRHPPVIWTAEHQRCAVDAAEGIYEDVMALEWPIADFLRAQALKRIWQAHLDTPDTLSAPPAELERRIAEQQALATQLQSRISAEALDRQTDRLLQCVIEAR